MTRIFFPLFSLATLAILAAVNPTHAESPSTPRAPAIDLTTRWTIEHANDWHNKTGWRVGCNYIPATAINQLEMFQAETFDPEQIDKELGWAQPIGFNTLRVYLHDLLWEQDSEGFLGRLDQFLKIADRHHIQVMFVLFDSCWDSNPKLGQQRAPRPGVHNSGWLQAPGDADLLNPARQGLMEAYVKGVVGRFANDPRVIAWDIWNEPVPDVPAPSGTAANPGAMEHSAARVEATRDLMVKAFGWAREQSPTQPLTSGVFTGPKRTRESLTLTERAQIDNSDVLSFHSYSSLPAVQDCVAALRQYRRPLICTEYMARTAGSTFDPIMGYLQRQEVGAINWGFVSGKTGTIFPWGSKEQTGTLAEPAKWFHDIFRADGTPFDPAEIAYIRSVTGATGMETAKPAEPQPYLPPEPPPAPRAKWR